MSSKKTPEINAGSMADITFLMLIFFLVTTTMDQDTGLSRRLPPMPTESQQQDAVNQRINRRNIIVVKINSRNSLMAGGQVLDVSQLKDVIKDFLTNPTDSPNKPEKEVKAIEGFGNYPVSKGVISLQNDRGTSYNAYIKVQNELVRAISELRDDFALAHFGKRYLNLDEEQQRITRDAIPSNISEAEQKKKKKR